MISYAKLPDTTWGIRGRGLEPGQLVKVTTKHDKKKSEIVGDIVWTGTDGAQLARIIKRNKRK